MQARPEVLDSKTHKLKFSLPDGRDVSFYVTIGFVEENRPWEVFVNVRDAHFWEHLVAVTVMVSRLLQSGTSLQTVVDDLKQIHSPNTGHFAIGGWSPSIYARIGSVLGKYIPKETTNG